MRLGAELVVLSESAPARPQSFKARMRARDLAACIALSDARKAELAAARARCQANPELCALLLSEARQRGESGIDWPEYFRNVRLND